MEKCSCERCAFESEHLACIFRDSGVDGIVELVRKHNYRKSYCEFVLLVWFLMNKTDHATVTVSTWSAIMSKIEKAAAIQAIPLRSYWAVLAAQSITTTCPDMYTSPFVHGLLTHELGKYTDDVVRKSVEVSVDVFEIAIISTLDFLVSYVFVWHPQALELIDGIDSSFFPEHRMTTSRTDLFDRALATSLCSFVHTLIMDVSFSSTSDVYIGQLLFLLRAMKLDVLGNVNSPLRESVRSQSLFGSMYYIAFDPACKMTTDSAFKPHRRLIADMVVGLTTGSMDTFLLVVKNEESKFISTKSFMLMTTLTRGLSSSVVNLTELRRILQNIADLRKSEETVTVVEETTPSDPETEDALARLIEQFDEEDKAADARRQKKRERKKERKNRKKKHAHPELPDHPVSTIPPQPKIPVVFELPPWNPVDDEVHALVFKSPWVF